MSQRREAVEPPLFEQLIGPERRARLYQLLNEVAGLYRGQRLPVSYRVDLGGEAVIVTLSSAANALGDLLPATR